MNVLIIFAIVEPTLAACLAGLSAMAVMGGFGYCPSLLDILSFMEVETLFLIFSIMLFVAVLVPVGIFDYLAVLIFKVNTY